jgi:hypothetical protein
MVSPLLGLTSSCSTVAVFLQMYSFLQQSVIMATNKFLNRILSPNMDGDIKTLHEYTHGLTSDPLLLMGIILSSVIHDVDHRGVSNMQMAKEEPEMAELYQNKSIAEQNSLDIAWDILMRPEFGLLRRAMFNDRKDMLRFRQVIVTVVLATDIFDKELNDLRKARWNKAFSEGVGSTDNNLRATIVIEHVIQASDISHTMQVSFLAQLSGFDMKLSSFSMSFYRKNKIKSIGTFTSNGTSACSGK